MNTLIQNWLEEDPNEIKERLKKPFKDVDLKI